MRFFLVIITLLFFGCMNSSNEKSEKFTFIFDFDDTMYSVKMGYPRLFIESIFGEKKAKKMLPELKKEAMKLQNIGLASVEVVRKMAIKYKIAPKQKDINYAVAKMRQSETNGLREVIKTLKAQGHQVLVMGGGSFGCAIIPEFMKPFGIEKSDIYTGYFKDFSKKELHNSLYKEYRYVNCGNLSLNTPVSHKKSEVIHYLKSQNIIKYKLVHIGDAENDLEVWRARAADFFIGFGVNVYNKTVEKEAKIYVKNPTEFRKVISKIIGRKV